ncbi:DEAD/DEAH box helicase [Leisingera aquaemixtae]|uniref:DEAD/DEAH box helicase n=1 Tax=Leisingera aquaemixtae TaxID=1396826 RepID=UPI001C93CEB7|nr:DEAD/DEAH box helicase [Leisingera aquaemixtae]MBY6067669.1 DEAD/DEAH box helicase [Leisingera aquaemixtae]
MGAEVGISKLREVLSDRAAVSEDPFGILQAITRLINDINTLDVGREMVIRALAVQNCFPKELQIILQSLIQSVGLFPYLDTESVEDLKDQITVEAHKSPFEEEGFLFHTLQLRVYRELLLGKNVVLSANTSVGKSLVVDAVIASGKHKHIAIIVPTIALIDETRRRLFRRFGGQFDLVTHPTQKTDASRPTIFVLTQERALGRDDLEGVTFFVIDEFYKLDINRDPSDRTIDLNICFDRLARSGAQFYLIGPNIDAVSGLGGDYEYSFYPSTFSTVATDVFVRNLPRDYDIRFDALREILFELSSPTLVYCQSPTKAAEVAESLLETPVFVEPKPQMAKAVDWLRTQYPNDWIFIRALERGIGIHHGNIPRALQQYVVRAFEQGLIKLIICTSTIIEGVNTVAENVIVFDKRIGKPGTPSLDNFTFKNISGRAGRMAKYYVGKVFVLESPPTEESSYEVSAGLDAQDETTPFSLILDLPVDSLTSISKERIREVEFYSPLSLSTIKLNRHIDADDQLAVFEMISEDLLHFEDTLVWKGHPKPHQLLSVCNIIYSCLDRGRSLGRYGIKTGAGLKAALDLLRTNKSFRPTIDYWVENKNFDDSVSKATENALQFMRRYVSYTFPRQLMAVSNIQAEIYLSEGRENVGDYSLFAAQAENLFMEVGLFALDEYGIPAELSRKLGREFGAVPTLGVGLEIVKGVNLSTERLHPFEKEIVADVQASLNF